MKKKDNSGTGSVPTEQEVREFFYGHDEAQGYAMPHQIDWIEELEDDKAT